MPELLFLAHRTPYPPNRGDRIRSYHLLKRLSRQAKIHLACLSEEPPSGQTMATLGGLCAQIEVAPIGKSRWAAAAAALMRGGSATEGAFHSRRLRRVISQWASQLFENGRRFDAVLAFCSSMVQYLDHPQLRDIPAIVDLVDVDSQKWLDYAAAARGRGLLKTITSRFYEIEGRRVRQLEKTLPARCQAITLVSEAEAALYQRIRPNDRTYAVGNGVDMDYFRPAALCETGGSGEPGRCVFVGSLDYGVNVEGLKWFCRCVWPQIRSRVPHATFSMVGRRPRWEVRQLARLAGVELVGSVADVRPEIRRAQIVVAPLPIARGVQNKVLEAMAMQRPVVATPEALEGIDLVPSVHALEADTPTQWTSVIVRLLEDALFREEVARRGRQFVEENHSWRTCLAPLDEIVQRVIGDCEASQPLDRREGEIPNAHGELPLCR